MLFFKINNIKAAFIATSCVILDWASYAAVPQPKLIVQLVVDQLRGDLIHRHQKQFGPHGFNYLLNHSINYYNAHHPHANTTTCAGHSTIATGSYPALHGIINNEWYDRKLKKLVYCMEDRQAKILSIAPTPNASPGRSPRNLYASTFSDELVLANKGQAYAVSFKDRSAIALAGHAGKAFWFDEINGGFISSSYYLKEYPLWVEKWNKAYSALDFEWHLSYPLECYQNGQSPAMPQQDLVFKQVFPHQVTHNSAHYFKALAKTPKADQFTADFAEQLLIQEGLGKKSAGTDYLAISFSAVDAIGHHFGPNSLEAEDNLLALDKTLSHLFAVIDKQVGLKNTLIILTADHGVNDGPSYLKNHHFREIKPINITQMQEHIQQFLKHRYQLPDATLLAITPPYVYLDHAILHQHRLNPHVVSHRLAQSLILKPGVFKAYTLPLVYEEKDWLSAKVNKMYYPERTGDIYLIAPPNQSNGLKNAYRITHGSPWRYDSYVPLLFSHPSLNSQLIARPIKTTDIAPTLAALLLIKAPSASVGTPLPEVIDAFQKNPIIKSEENS